MKRVEEEIERDPQEEEDEQQEIVEELIRGPPKWTWLLAFGALALSVYFPVFGVYTIVLPLIAVLVLIVYSMILGLLSLTWGLIISLIVGIFSSFYLSRKSVEYEWEQQKTAIEEAYPRPMTGGVFGFFQEPKYPTKAELEAKAKAKAQPGFFKRMFKRKAKAKGPGTNVASAASAASATSASAT